MNRTDTHPRWSASQLRRDLNDRALHHARFNGLLHEQTIGSSPCILFGHEGNNEADHDASREKAARHGNFHPASYAAILSNPAWQQRLTKAHTAHRRSRALANWQWRELDSASSSDALLMNIFCHPGVFDGTRLSSPVANILGVASTTHPAFGLHPGVPVLGKYDELKDRTEIDLQLDSLFLEAKLTESNFQTAKLSLLERYRDLETVFDVARLPRRKTPSPTPQPITDADADYNQQEYDRTATNEAPLAQAPDEASSANDTKETSQTIQGYQLIRNVLAAYAAEASFCVLCDGRRHDLIATWYAVLTAVHRPTFATRLKLLTWQELAATLPEDLQLFLEAKYGINPRIT